MWRNDTAPYIRRFQLVNAPWPNDLVLSAKTGSTNDASGRGVRWLVGHIQRGNRAFLFVSCVVGASDVAANAAIDLAAASLRAEGVW
jgi:beta-lactamase class D